ncbi:hypothetical protein QBC46DRAFT_358357 [Diplogelasinospora grovesii]|uniref:Zn(2)-C6 fungal-type domain-containing protein n=1 Tax=Diplogelasinospora grovesii TaxID=303347 RepID=A0AAN6S0I2_9PEZI|nr:hypothetical protein QBC46DRAFT_358357 [Diplogelasinospora grovesii]
MASSQQRLQFVHAESHRACINCAAAKAKCVPREGAGGCERCHRSQKECVAQQKSKPQRQKRKRTATALEEKVDEIVALLAAKSTTSTNGNLNPEEQSTEPAVQSRTQSGSVRSSAVFSELGVSEGECDALLSIFRTRQSAYCPWVSIPSSTTASSLLSQKPLLYLAIMLAASFDDFNFQKRIARTVFTYLADQIICQGKKNLDLLQGLLVLIHYYHTQLLDVPQITNLAHLCMALTNDLTYNHTPPAPNTFHSFLLDARKTLHDSEPSYLDYHALPSTNTTRSSESEYEFRRAVVGCFYATSVLSSSFNSFQSYQWSLQLEDSLRILEGSQDERDWRLVKMIKLQHLTGEVYQIQKDLALASKSAVQHLNVYIEPFEERLEEIWADVPAHLRNDLCLMLGYLGAKMHIYKFSILDLCRPPSQTSTATPAELVSFNDARYKCLEAAMACMDCFLNMPKSEFYALPLMMFAQIGHAISTLIKLRCCKPALPSQAWLVVCGRTLIETFETVAERMEEIIDENRAVSTDERGPDLERPTTWIAWLRRCVAKLRKLDHLPEATGADLDLANPPTTQTTTTGTDRTVAGKDTPASNLTEGSTANTLVAQEGIVEGYGGNGGVGNTDWMAMLDDVSSFGMFGVSDEAIFQEFFTGGDNWT